MEKFVPTVVDCLDIFTAVKENPSKESYEKFSSKVCTALKEDGFLYLINHGVSSTTVIFIAVIVYYSFFVSDLYTF